MNSRDAMLARYELARFAQRPIVRPHPHPPCIGARKIEAGARGPLRVHQPAAGRIGERGMRDDDLARGERARVLLLELRLRAKESDLETQLRVSARGEPARHVPPLDAEVRMAAVVPGEASW